MFPYPQWFLLLLFFGLIGWYLPRLELWRPRRILLLALITLILVDPRIKQLKDGLDLWVLIDRSASAEKMVDQDIDEWRGLLEKSRPSDADRLHFIDYASEVVTQTNIETTTYPGSKNLSRTALALENVLALSDRKKRSRILIFTDGYSTEPLTGISEKLQAMEIPLDYRLLSAKQTTDYQIRQVKIPKRTQRGEPFLIEIDVIGNQDGEVPISIYRNQQKLGESTVSIQQGHGQLKFTDRITQGGSFQYEARISPAEDAHAGNNRYQAWVEVHSGPRVLLISHYTDDPLLPILQNQGFEVQLINDPLTLTLGQLSGCKNVILNNVPAHEIPSPFLKALNFFVSEQGGGLLMVGGKRSFGSGGYYDSPIDSLLPVSMELKNDHRKLAVAMAIVMDRSGSMAMTASGGRSKMQLANEGAARAVELLGMQDLITIQAVDSKAHIIVPLMNVSANRAQIINRARSIQSMGGGIFVYEGLKSGWNSLKKAQVGQRHMILFTDAADSEQPGNYKSLLKEITADGGTVSVIGLGTRADSDAAFIEDVAKRGNGRIFFTTDAATLPNIFAQETVTVARSTFIEDSSATQATGGWFEIANRDAKWLDSIDGYNLSYLKDGDTAALISADEYAAPLVATGRRGIGRSAAISFPLGGEFSQKARDWQQLGDFIQTLNRWLMGERTPPGIGIRTKINGTLLTIDLLYDDQEWGDRFAATPPRIVLSEGLSQSPTKRELTWERISPERYSVQIHLKEEQMLRGAIQISDQYTLPFGPLVLGSSREWALDPESIEELTSLSAASQGRPLLDLPDAWQKPLRKDYSSIQAWLLSLLLVGILFDALITRTGWSLPSMNLAWLKKTAKQKKSFKQTQRKIQKPETQTSLQPSPEKKKSPRPQADPPPQTSDSARSRFARAKRRGK
ncbi:MAG: VWA domain-containing protein [Verrucomicrobiales bacterium]|nr:VWA domain-containing protein [Verrucomicrobiales bacterium]